MARKDLLKSITDKVPEKPQTAVRADYAKRGASRTMMKSIDELAAVAEKLRDGEVVVELDPNLCDPSFVTDRLEGREAEYLEFRETIKRDGQETPIVVRLHPKSPGRYMIVFGHWRTRAARELQRTVKAVIREMNDTAHVIAQGQENSARANLTFIEKAVYGQKLLELGYSKEVVKSALTVDDTLLSRMLAVVEIVPMNIIEAIGAAKGVGRDRWEELKKRLLHPASKEAALQFVQSADLSGKGGAERFDALLSALKATKRKRKPASPPAARSGAWSPPDGLVSARFQNLGRTFTVSLKAKHAGAFGQYLVANLEDLYQAFKEAEERQQQHKGE